MAFFFAKHRHLDGPNRDELGLELGLAILEQQADDFLQVGLQLIERFALAVRAGPARDMSDEQASVRVAFDDDIERSHASGYSPHGRLARVTPRIH